MQHSLHICSLSPRKCIGVECALFFVVPSASLFLFTLPMRISSETFNAVFSNFLPWHCRITVFVCMRAWRLWLKCMDRNALAAVVFDWKLYAELIEIKMRAHICVRYNFWRVYLCMASLYQPVQEVPTCKKLQSLHNFEQCFWTWHQSILFPPLKQINNFSDAFSN